MAGSQTHVIVGAGLAGARAAAALRADGFDGQIVLVGAEPYRPYERPPLSKEVLRGEAPIDKTFVHDETFYADSAIALRTDTRVTRIDPVGNVVHLEGGEQLGYDRLLIATGSRSRRLQIPGSDLEGIHYLRDIADLESLRAGLSSATTVAVVGAGWIGSEVAASARQMGHEVTLVEPGSVPLARVLGEEVGTIYKDLHTEHGVKGCFGVGVVGFEGDGRATGVRLEDGRVVDADLVVVGVGAVPRTELAAEAGLEVDNGIVVNDRLQTSNPDIFAAGDVAYAWHPRFGERLRVEHWSNAIHQGETAAKNMLGGDVVYDRLPYFYSDQYDLGMEYSGFATEWDQVVFRGDVAKREFIAFWVRDGKVVAAMNANVWDVIEELKAIISAGRPVDVGELTDPGVALTALAGVG